MDSRDEGTTYLGRDTPRDYDWTSQYPEPHVEPVNIARMGLLMFLGFLLGAGFMGLLIYVVG